MTFSPAPNPHNKLNHVKLSACRERGRRFEHGSLLFFISNYFTYNAEVQAWERSIICMRSWNKSLNLKKLIIVTTEQPPSPLMPIKRKYKTQVDRKLSIFLITVERIKETIQNSATKQQYNTSFQLSIHYWSVSYICVCQIWPDSTHDKRESSYVAHIRQKGSIFARSVVLRIIFPWALWGLYRYTDMQIHWKI